MQVKDWQKFQHFHNRKPPWIKLYRDILDDPEWHGLDGLSAKVLVMVWLLASEDKTQTGMLPSVSNIAFRLRMTDEKINQAISKLSHWIYQDDIKMISSRYQDDTPEREREGEKERDNKLSGMDPDTANSFTQPKEKIPHAEIIAHLNAVGGTDFKPGSQTTRRLIKARWNEGHSLDDFLAVIDHKGEEWLGDEKMNQYFRPQTLFSAKFESYLQAAKMAGTGSKPKRGWSK